MADWEEVKRLAADFQRVQLSTTKQKLSERNIVELVTKLIELKLIDVIYTTDGKEYLTHQELAKEIREELYVHGGRINLVELQQILNVDLNHIQAKVNSIVGQNRKISLVLGQLIDVTYKDRLAEEVNDKLTEQGQVTIAELTKTYDLPADFLTEVVRARLGSIIKGQLDSYDRDVIFTHAFVTRMKARIRGSLSAVTKPTPVLSVMSQHGCKERLFHTILEKLIKTGRLAGSVSGGKKEKATYIPDIYTQSQNEWVDAFYKQNGYLEYDSLSRLGISDVKSFIKKRFKDEPITYLKTCCAGKGIQDQIEATAEEALSTGGWVDIMTVMPSIFSVKDAGQLLTNYLRGRQGVIVCCESIVASESLISECSKPFSELMTSKARKEAKSNPVFLNTEGDKKGGKLAGLDDGSSAREDKKDQRRKKAASSTKSGGGTQGREAKMKATKKKYRTGRGDQEDDSDDDTVQSSNTRTKPGEVTFMTITEMSDVIRKQEKLQDCPEDLISEIASKLYRPLTRQFQEVAKSIFMETSGTATGSDRKKTHGELQEKVSGLWTNAKLFEKGLKHFGGDTHVQLVKYLLNTVCTDITNIVLNAVATDSLMSVIDDEGLTPEARLKVISSLPAAEQTMMTKLHMSVTGKHSEPIENVNMNDNISFRQIVFNHRQSLVESVKDESDPAMALHLAAVMLFQTYTQMMVHAPGRVVPQIIEYLESYMVKDQHKTLVTLQEHVVKQAKLQADGAAAADAEAVTAVMEEIKPLLPQVKEIALTAKRNSPKEEEDK
ncbi:LOW QUALITY PROTEIN: E3 UFM1-protein ligase 1-like [Haliotis rubra]|uniref:LOW QUALITY PROTEIN: E3 UFM1-protein ligase 1-like n=1 Tax=Haliotis rubra TaxID=36100 RepID=UPI001EE5E75C|nr:LOW QUALITY PROTEIN: E3 UFM1-protein ligase 1-like [Haliotis rubra]